jgi:alcohol dehydrogenase class IV
VPDIQINQELLRGSGYFSDPALRAEATAYFGFDQRRILLGDGALGRLGDECHRLGAQSVFLVRDAGLAAWEEPVRRILADAGKTLAGVYDKATPNPTVESVTALAADLKTADCQALIALGGGSTIDAAKAAACLATEGGDLSDYFGFDHFNGPARWPLLAVPTTAGTGSEASRVAVVADANGKQAIYSDYLTPRVALVDPRLTQHLPATLTAVSGLDALGHALECTASKKSNPLGDAIARAALESGCLHLVSAIEDGPNNAEARYHMARCALLAGLLLSPINTGAAHALGYGIEKLSAAAGKPVPHGAAVSLVLPGVMRHNAPAAADKYYFMAGVAGLKLAGLSREAGVEKAALWLDGLRRSHTPFASLRASGLNEKDIPAMTEIALGIRRLLDPNPIELGAQDATQIYRAVLD